jgi:hypothetical protein
LHHAIVLAKPPLLLLLRCLHLIRQCKTRGTISPFPGTLTYSEYDSVNIVDGLHDVS